MSHVALHRETLRNNASASAPDLLSEDQTALHKAIRADVFICGPQT